ncbi:MAG TPA: TenA family protein, partial [Acidimicrobiales bacterium]|nr:TenA family protein [Acidimicrobiales bacterium]
MASLSDSLWDRNRVLAEAALEHKFVQGIASGELARATFAYYVGQDAVFLDAFCRAYALALAKSPDREGLIAFRELLDAAADELRLHMGYAARWGVDLYQAADPATSAYTGFLLAVAALEPVGHIVAAMTPCMRLYAFLGQRLAAHTKPEGPYREWVETYSSAEFEALAR